MIGHRIAEEAREDLRARVRWYRYDQQAPEAVIDRFLAAFEGAVMDLRRWPGTGRLLRDGAVYQLMNLPKPFGRHVILFTVEDNVLLVHRLIGAEQDRDRYGRNH